MIGLCFVIMITLIIVLVAIVLGRKDTGNQWELTEESEELINNNKTNNHATKESNQKTS